VDRPAVKQHGPGVVETDRLAKLVPACVRASQASLAISVRVLYLGRITGLYAHQPQHSDKGQH
jgi:hypothetical protein